jgi:hypothetical protein
MRPEDFANRYEAVTGLPVALVPGRWQMLRCPAHQDRSPSLAVIVDERGLGLRCFAGCEREAVLGALGLDKGAGRLPPPGPPAPRRADGRRQSWLVGAWRRATPAENWSAVDGPATRYVEARGLQAAALRLGPWGWPAWRATRWRSGDRWCWALVAPMVGPAGGVEGLVPACRLLSGVGADEAFCGLHVTLLSDDGTKLDRRTYGCAPGSLVGGRVALWPWPTEGPLQVAEGVEDALAVALLTGHPAVATGGTSGMANLVVPDGWEVWVYADADEAGRQAAEALRRRLGAARVRVFVPPAGCKDPAEALGTRVESGVASKHPEHPEPHPRAS